MLDDDPMDGQQTPPADEQKQVIAIVLVNDTGESRDTLQNLLQAQADFALVGMTGSGEEAIEQAINLQPDVVIIDAELSGTDSFDIVARIMKAAPATTVIMVSPYRDIDQMRRAMRAGAYEFVSEPGNNAEELYTKIRRAFARSQTMAEHLKGPAIRGASRAESRSVEEKLDFDTELADETVAESELSDSGERTKKRKAPPSGPQPPVPGAMPLPPSPPKPEAVGYSEGDDAGIAREGATEAAQDVRFSAYYPREVKLDDWQPLIAYVYQHQVSGEIAEDARKQLGEALADMRTVDETATQPIQEGVTITATPRLEGFQFNPASVSVGFFETWHRLDFKLRAASARLNIAANGTLTFTVEGVIVADIPLSIFVGETVTDSEPTSAVVHPYPAIFASYSHDDTHIVERVERAYQALGMDYLRDVHALKSGQDWDDQLLALIEQADIFQLFWSTTAAASPYVRQEWEHALGLEYKTETFVRPVYWEQPMPPVPGKLSHIHFAYQPELDD